MANDYAITVTVREDQFAEPPEPGKPLKILCPDRQLEAELRQPPADAPTPGAKPPSPRH